MTAKRIVVSGGNGFLGQAVCRAAVARGWRVTSLSRSGQPAWDKGMRPLWAERVHWHQADVFAQNTYREVMEGCDSVVHTIGILLEFNYKQILSGSITGKDLMSRGFIDVFAPNPLTSETRPNYTKFNVDSVAVARAAAQSHSAKSFVYISAADTFPGIPSGYLQSKRQAEVQLQQFDTLRTIFLRPGFMYSPERASSMPIAQVMTTLAGLNSFSGNRLSGLLRAAAVPPLPIETVAEAALECVSNSLLEGPVLPPQITDLFHSRAPS